MLPRTATTTLLLLAACDGPDPIDTGEPAPTDTAVVYSGRVAGTVVTPDGAPIGDLRLSLCAEVCQLTETVADGSFVFEGVRPGVPVLEAFAAPGDDPRQDILGWTRFFDFVRIADGEQITIARPHVMWPVTTQGDLAGVVDLRPADGLAVQFDAARFGTDSHPLPAPADELRFGAIEVPSEHWPRQGLGDWTIQRAWGLAIWDLASDDVFAVQATIGEALPPGTEVAILVADYTYGFEHGRFFEERAQLSEDGLTITTPTDGGLDRATLWLAVSRNAPETPE